MSDTPARPPQDGLETYFTEKLWEWIPGIHKHEDGLADNPGVLRSLIEIAGVHAAVARRGIDRVWENEFGDYADDWALPYIADLVGTRLISPLNRGGRRADVVRTIFYRRRKGTVAVLEALIREIGRWDGAVVEAFQRLGRTPHRLDAPLQGKGAARPGVVTVTPQGGFADLRATRGSELVDGPFEEYSRTADVRQLRGRLGRFNIPKINFHLYRQLEFAIVFGTPFDLGGNRFTFDPSGRDTPLFKPSRHNPIDCSLAEEWRIAGPISCRLLSEARFRMRPEHVPPALVGQLTRMYGVTVRGELKLRALLSSLLAPLDFAGSIYGILAASITDDSPKRNLIPDAVSVAVGPNNAAPVIARERVMTANLEIGAVFVAPAGKQLVIDPHRARFLLLAPPAAGDRVFVPRHHVGLFGPLGAGPYDRRATVVTTGVNLLPNGGIANPGPVGGFPLPVNNVHQFRDSKTYEPNSPPGAIVAGVRQLTLQAADGARPYVRLIPAAGGTTWTFRALPKPPGFDPLDPANRRTLILDGLWLGIVPAGLAPQMVPDNVTPATPVVTTIVLDGVFDEVVFRHCTIDPGGEVARVVNNQVTPIPFVSLEITGQVERLVIERSIVGPITEISAAADPCSTGRIEIRDSVVQSIVDGAPAIETRIATVVLERSTVFGDVLVNRLDASDTLIQGFVQVTDNQHGCFRFSAAQNGLSRLPRQFESHLFSPKVSNHVFVSRRFGDPGFAQLSATAPESLRRGAENTSEIGVWNRLLTPIRLDDLRAKAMEYMPFGRIAQFIEET